METTTEYVAAAAENVNNAILGLIYSNSESIMHLLESINTYLQIALIFMVGLLLYKFITAFTGT